MIKKNVYSVVILVSILSLTACGPSMEDAKKLGFHSVDEMKELTARGFTNYETYFKSVTLTPSVCFQQQDHLGALKQNLYDDLCREKWVTWIVQNKGDYVVAKDIFVYLNGDISWDSGSERKMDIKSIVNESKITMKSDKFYLIDGKTGSDQGIWHGDLYSINVIKEFATEEEARKKAKEFYDLRKTNEAQNKVQNEIEHPTLGRPKDQLELEERLEYMEARGEEADLKGERGRDDFEPILKAFWENEGLELFKKYQGKSISNWVCKYTNPTGWDPKEGLTYLNCKGQGKYAFRSTNYYLSIPESKRNGVKKIYTGENVYFSGVVDSIKQSGPYGFSMEVSEVEIK